MTCAWADNFSIGMVFFFNRESASAEALFRQVREAVETRG